MESYKNWEKIGKHLKGEESEEEKKSFLQWLDQDKKNKEEFADGEKIWRLTEESSTYTPDLQKAWNRFQNTVDSLEKEEADEVPVRVFKFSSSLFVKIAAVFIVTIGLSYIAFNYFSNDELEVQTAEHTTGEIVLPDGSEVWLNKNSKLTYSKDFNIKNRIVTLSGEAFFAVKKADGNTFTIHTNNSKTEVLGTEFNVRGYEGDSQVQVTVLEGQVAFSDRQNEQKVFLLPGEKGLITKNNAIQKIKSENNNEIAWKTKQLTFDNTHLSNVLQTLENYYGTKIIVNNENILNCRFTGNFNDSNLKEILEILSISVDLTYQEENSAVVLKGMGCKP